jgi:mediator of RNA polymerase II transcription subunit 5
VKLHEDSGHLPLGNLVASIEDPLTTLLKVDRCLRLLRLAGTAQTQSARQQNLLVNSGKLLMHLLSCVNDISVLPFQEAYHLWDQTNTLLMSGVGLSENLRGSLSSFLWSLNLHLSSDETTGKEAQMIQNMQMAKGDIGGPNSENDIITLGLLLQYLVRPFYPPYHAFASF